MRRSVRTIPVLVLLAACAGSPDQAQSANASSGTSTSSSTPEHEPARTSEDGMPAPVEVCVEENGALTPATVEASRAGTYDPSAPIDETLLNWFVSGSYCVTYPAHALRRARCGERTANAPVVTRTLCQQ